VIGNLDLLAEALQRGSEQLELADEARKAALRGAELTAGLLAFARRQPLQSQMLDLNALVRQSSRLFDRTLGEDVAILLDLDDALWPVRSDAGKIETCLLNLVVNARDAMPDGGTVTITTSNATLDPDAAARDPDLAPGDFVLLSVSDMGSGMPPEILARAFEPFFTTKEQGKGTGLGLSLVFGFARQSGGNVKIYSEVGLGTCVKLYLPRADGVGEAAGPASHDPDPARGNRELVLVVEDSDQVRDIATKQLAQLGYRTLAAADAPAAIGVLERRGDIDAVLTDIVMPGGMNGVALARRIAGDWPGIAVVLMSGFPARAAAQLEAIPEGMTLLSKPYRKADLGRVMRTALANKG
jgi:CheY-like chemotaxis protein